MTCGWVRDLPVAAGRTESNDKDQDYLLLCGGGSGEPCLATVQGACRSPAPTPRRRPAPTPHRRAAADARSPARAAPSQESSREPCLEPSRVTDTPPGRKPHPRSANGRDSESLGFIPGSADSGPPVRTCGACTPCTPPGWGGCREVICCIVTCGVYGSRQPCLSSVRAETSTDNPGQPDPHDCPPNGVALTTAAVRQEPRTTQPAKLPPSDSFRYGDVRIGGKRVDYSAVGPPRRNRPPGAKTGESQRPVSNTSVTSVYSREELDFLDDLSDSGTDIDSLITKKLLELYKLHQIDQLAKCTSDSSFSRKTNEISDLIYCIAQDYNLEEQEAECRLVHGVIRISTRKSKRTAPKAKDPAHNPPAAPLNGKRDGTLPDSGNETMTDTFYSNDTEPEVKVSQQTPSDALARRMRISSGREYSSGAQDTETDSSGTPLLQFIRT
ncbi:hypothetical protein SKAU_G00330910 [Synaphobranchus kaupii]|uniref:Keratinocyte differentiation factor 1 n=1 Tax=Synaphobranchus kaupii TaxID=118154 RepID=A0A9Q1IHJ3_SYNKA|nr:hypothetical protein SKAU_G00330910 [Synaphobranchus kaupii]